MESQNILLIEVLEKDIENINIPYTLFGVVAKQSHAKARALFAKLNDQRKAMSETYKEIDKLWTQERENT